MSSPRRKIHIYVQHLLGAGHLVRMQTLAECFAATGHTVTLISGGVPIDDGASDGDYNFVQLPAIKVAAGDFTQLLTAAGEPVTEQFKQDRAAQLLNRVRDDAPEVLIVETFPFGRRQLRFELTPLMQTVADMRPRPLRLASVRDILQLRTDDRYRQSVTEVNAWFDYVAVHADPQVATLSETFPAADEIRDKIFYSGYVYRHHHAAADGKDNGARDQVIVSAGGGAVGLALLETAIAARAHSRLNDRPWRLLAGRRLDGATFAALQKSAGHGIIIERNRLDFAALLSACAVSVSQSGYNTVLDVVAANARAVFVPFARDGETEQTHRAKKIAAHGRAVVLAEDGLTPRKLAAAIDSAAELNVAACPPIKMNGAEEMCKFIERVADNELA